MESNYELVLPCSPAHNTCTTGALDYSGSSCTRPIWLSAVNQWPSPNSMVRSDLEASAETSILPKCSVPSLVPVQS